MTALDLAEELIVLRDLEWGIPVLAAPEYLAMKHSQIVNRREVVEGLLRNIEVSGEPPPKVRVTAKDFLG